ncbi:MAG TPA: type II toxin-antitoxin system YafQ family toxin [Gammaproteobacteria bacterium]|nr:type II toxin-antitoxin system YafQ family toxin [Gammaproteobacteria bacterium]
MLEIVRSGQFKRDVKLAGKRGQDMDKLRHVLELLVAGKPLPARYQDHPLKGDWAGFRDLHLAPDWLLIYRVHDEALELARTGSHSDIFEG